MVEVVFVERHVVLANNSHAGKARTRDDNLPLCLVWGVLPNGFTTPPASLDGGPEGLITLQENVNPNSSSQYSQTLLWEAAEHSCVEIMKLLLEWEEINPDRRHKYGWTLALWAAKYGRVGR